MKKVIKKALDYFEFTPTELRIIVFLTIAILAGGGITLWKANHLSPEVPVANLSQLEKDFLERSQYSEVGTSKSQTDKVARKAKPAIEFPFDLNQVTADELTSIPTIGPQIARRIIQFRQRIGRFQHIEQLKKVKGIGKKRFEKIRKYVTIAGSREEE